MKTWNFFVVYAKRTVRDRMFFMIMLLFPVLLIWLLGNAFSGIMGDRGSEGIIKANMLYHVQEESQLSKAFEQYMVDDENEYFSFQISDEPETAKEDIVRNRFDAYVEISEDSMTIYKNSNYNLNSTLGELILKSFADDYNLMYEISSLGVTVGSPGEGGSFTEEISFDRERTPGSMDYYGITMSTMFIFYGMIFLGTYFAGNKQNKTLDRINASPANLLSYQWGTAAGSIALLVMQSMIVISFGIFVFNVYWGGALTMGALVIFAEIVMVSAMGTLFGLLVKSENLIAGISQIVIPVIVFLGDGYVQIGGGKTINAIKKISPMFWVNHGIFDAVYAGEYSTAYTAVAICLGVAVFCTLAVLFMNRGRRQANA